MKQLFENEVQTIYFHEDIKAFEQRFKPKSAEVFGEAYINEARIFGECIENYQTPDKNYSNLIINTLAGGPTMEPKVQAWMHDFFYPKISAAGIKCKAYCLGEDIISKLSVELTAEDDPNAMFKFRFFATLEEGLDWLSKV